MSTHKIPSCYRNSKRYPYYASCPGAIINPHWLELPLSRTNFHGPKVVRTIEVLLYIGTCLIGVAEAYLGTVGLPKMDLPYIDRIMFDKNRKSLHN